MHTNFAVGNISVKAKDEHVINAIFNAIFKNTNEWTNSFRVEDKAEMKQEGFESRKFAYYGESGCNQSVSLFMVNADMMLRLWMPKIHDFLVANEFTISFKFVNCCVRAQLLVGMTIEIHHNGTSGILRLRAMTASLRGRFSVTSDLTEKRYKKVARQVLFSRFLRLEVGVVVKYRYGNCNIAI